MKEELQVGDKVKIVSSPYRGHVSRGIGGTGTVQEVKKDAIDTVFMAVVAVDNADMLGDGSNKNLWAFFVGELEKLP